MLLFLDLELPFTALDLDAQADSVEIGSRTSISSQCSRPRLFHLRCLAANVRSNLLSGTLLSPLATIGSTKPALIDELVGPCLRVLRVDHLARLVLIGRLCA